MIGNDLSNQYHDNYLAIGNYITGSPNLRDGVGKGLEINGSILVGGVLWLEDGYLGDLFPSPIAEAGGITLTHNLGTLTKPWGTVYAKSLDISGTAAISGNTSVYGTLTTSGNATFKGTLTSGTIYPYTSSSSIGSTRNRWSKVYTNDLNANGQLTISSSSYTYPVDVTNSISTSSTVAAVHGKSTAGTSACYGLYGEASSSSSGVHNHGVSGVATGGECAVGVYGYAYGATYNYGGWFTGAVNVDGDLWYRGVLLSTSDSRLKKDVQNINGALDKVLKLRGVTYYWKNREEMAAAKGVPADSMYYGYDNKKHIGVIAQEIEQEFPELVKTDIDGFKTVDYVGITPILIEAVKELKAEKDELQTTVTNQQQQIDELKRLVEELLKKQ